MNCLFKERRSGKMAIIHDVITYFEMRYPSSIRDMAYDEKNTGLLHGSRDTVLTNITLSLECSLEAIDYAVSNNANLIICHHTPFFQPIYKYDDRDYRFQVLKKLIKHDIAVYCSHTAVDRAKAEYNMSGLLARAFNFTNIRPLEQDEAGYGLGVQADAFMTQEQLLNCLAEKVAHVRTNQVIKKEIKKVAILGGSGEYYWRLAKQKGCDAFLTGDLTFHTAQDAHREDFLIIDIGHEAEAIGLSCLQTWLSEQFPVFFFEQKVQILQ